MIKTVKILENERESNCHRNIYLRSYIESFKRDTSFVGKELGIDFFKFKTLNLVIQMIDS